MVAHKKPRRAKCLQCPNKAFSRGLCSTCLSAAHRLINSGQKTEQQLIDAGAMLPSKKSGRPRGSAYAKRLAKLQKV